MTNVLKEAQTCGKVIRVFDHTQGPRVIDCKPHCPAAVLGEKDPIYRFSKMTFSIPIPHRGPFCKISPLEYEAENRRGLARRWALLWGSSERKCVYWDSVFKNKATADNK